MAVEAHRDSVVELAPGLGRMIEEPVVVEVWEPPDKMVTTCKTSARN
jgi:hypothetical protein